jgi:hypothetical protein
MEVWPAPTFLRLLAPLVPAVAKDWLADVFHDVAIGECSTKPKAHHDVPIGALAVWLYHCSSRSGHGYSYFFLWRLRPARCRDDLERAIQGQADMLACRRCVVNR